MTGQRGGRHCPPSHGEHARSLNVDVSRGDCGGALVELVHEVQRGDAHRVVGLDVRPAVDTLPRQAGDLRAKVETIQAEGLGAASLTTAELRLLPMLSTHLSFREIGERLYVSRHTVKSQAISIYRKLGVTSRSGAIDRMHDLGLTEHI